jgi:hypothetical protein
MSFKWNEPEQKTTSIWNTSINSETLWSDVRSIKERLKLPANGTRIDDHLRDIGQGIAMIMDYIETKEKQEPTPEQPTVPFMQEPNPMRENITEAEFRAKHDGHSWVYVDEDCPVCQGNMTENFRGISCSQRGCGYKK